MSKKCFRFGDIQRAMSRNSILRKLNEKGDRFLYVPFIAYETMRVELPHLLSDHGFDLRNIEQCVKYFSQRQHRGGLIDLQTQRPMMGCSNIYNLLRKIETFPRQGLLDNAYKYLWEKPQRSKEEQKRKADIGLNRIIRFSQEETNASQPC